MRLIPKAITIATVAGGLVFGATLVVQMRELLARQPPHQPQLPMPPNATGFPPSAAWAFAAPYGIGVFAIVLA